jgi:four helix bundle suffix protein
MVLAERSGKQNIVEGCSASSTLSKTEIKLLNVAKASLQELLEDYLLFRQLESLEKAFLREGGFSERMIRIRKERRGY